MHKSITCSLLAATLVASTAALAQAWPAKPIRFIVPFPPGGTTDIQARMINERLGAKLGQPVVLDNRGGANGAIGMEIVARAPADGYTMIISTVGTWTVAPHLSKLPYDVQTDFAPLIHMATTPGVLLVHPSVPAKNVKELITLAKTRPGELTYGSSGIGGFGQMCAELFAVTANIKMTHVPYKGSAPAMIDLIGGRVDFMFDVMLNSGPHIQSGKLRPIAVTNTTGLSYVPGVPPVSKTVPGYEVLGFVCLIAAAGTPKPVIDKLYAETVRVMKLPDVVESYAKIGFDARTNTPTELAAVMKKELELWGPVVKSTSASTN